MERLLAKLEHPWVGDTKGITRVCRRIEKRARAAAAAPAGRCRRLRRLLRKLKAAPQQAQVDRRQQLLVRIVVRARKLGQQALGTAAAEAAAATAASLARKLWRKKVAYLYWTLGSNEQ